MAPEVIVEHVSANAYWNRKNARMATPVEPYVSGAPCRKKYWWPMIPFPEPNMKAKPNAQKRSPQRHVSTMPSRRTLTVSRVRANPASRNMNPACMKKTRKAVTQVHIVLIAFTYGGGGASSAKALCPK